MSTNDQFIQEAKSSVALEMNSKGEAQVKVKVYDGVDEGELIRIRRLAVDAYNLTVAEVRT